jgi:hypothetical protein
MDLIKEKAKQPPDKATRHADRGKRVRVRISIPPGYR